jgi:hypothetical protein
LKKVLFCFYRNPEKVFFLLKVSVFKVFKK